MFEGAKRLARGDNETQTRPYNKSVYRHLQNLAIYSHLLHFTYPSYHLFVSFRDAYYFCVRSEARAKIARLHC